MTAFIRETKSLQFDRVPHKNRQAHPCLSRADAAHHLENPPEHPRVALTGRRSGGAKCKEYSKPHFNEFSPNSVARTLPANILEIGTHPEVREGNSESEVR